MRRPSRRPASEAKRCCARESSPVPTRDGSRPSGSTERAAGQPASGSLASDAPPSPSLGRIGGPRPTSGRPAPSPQPGDLALAIRVDTVGQDQEVRAADRVRPDGRARVPGVPDGAHRKEGAEGARVGRGHVPAQRAPGVANHLRLQHAPNARRRQVAASAEDAAVEKHPTEAGQVVGAPEEAGVAGHPPEGAGVAVVDVAAEHLAAEHLGGGESAPPGERRIEAGVLHAERLVEAPSGELIQGTAADAAHDLAQQDESGVAVVEAGPRREVEPGPDDLGQQAGDGLRASPGLGKVRHAGAVEENSPERHLAIGGGGQLGQVPRDGGVEVQSPVLGEGQDGGSRRDDLGQRGEIEDRVDGHRLLGGPDGPEAESLPVEDPIAPPDEDHRAREVAGGDGIANGLVDGVGPVRRVRGSRGGAGRGRAGRGPADRRAHPGAPRRGCGPQGR